MVTLDLLQAADRVARRPVPDEQQESGLRYSLLADERAEQPDVIYTYGWIGRVRERGRRCDKIRRHRLRVQQRTRRRLQHDAVRRQVETRSDVRGICLHAERRRRDSRAPAGSYGRDLSAVVVKVAFIDPVTAIDCDNKWHHWHDRDSGRCLSQLQEDGDGAVHWDRWQSRSGGPFGRPRTIRNGNDRHIKTRRSWSAAAIGQDDPDVV